MVKIINLYKRFEYHFWMLLSATLGLTPILWFKGKILSSEEFYSVDYGRWSTIFTRAWESYVNYGEPSMLMPLRLQGLFFNLLKTLHVSNYLSLEIWYVTLWVITAVSYYIFLAKVFEGRRYYLLIFAATIYYIYSPFFLNISALLTPPRFIFIALPLILYNQLVIFDSSSIPYKQLFYIALTTVFTAPIFSNLPLGISMLILIYLGVLYKYLALSFDLKKLLHALSFLSVLLILFNLWWLVPVGNTVISSLGTVKDVTSSFSAVASSGLYDVLSQFGSWAFREKIWGYDYYYFPYYKAFDNFPLILVRHLPLIFVAFALIKIIESIKSRKSALSETNLYIFFALVFVTFNFLSKGTSGLFGGIFQLIFEKVPGFWIFREPYAKFMPVVCAVTGPLLIEGALYIFSFIDKRIVLKHVLAVCVCLGFLCLGFPFWKGDIVWRINDNDVRSYEVDKPNYWTQLSTVLQTTNTFSLIYPSHGLSDRYVWSSGYIGNPFLLFTNLRVLNPQNAYSVNPGVQEVIRYIYRKVFSDPTWFDQNSSRYAINNLIFQADTAYTYEVQNRSQIKNAFNRFFEISFDKLDIYKFSESSLFDLIPRNNILSVAQSDTSSYDAIRKLIAPDTYLNFVPTADNADIRFAESVSVTENNNVFSHSYAPLTLIPADYAGFYVSQIAQPVELLLDNDKISTVNHDATLEFTIPKEKLCCKKMSANLSDSGEVSLQNDWIIYKKIEPNKYAFGKGTGTKLLMNNKDFLYKKLISTYEPYGEYIVHLSGSSNITGGFSLYITQKNKATSEEKTITGGRVSGLNHEADIVLPRTTEISTTDDAEYFLVFSRADETPNQNTKLDEFLSLDSIKLIRKTPKIVLINDKKYKALNVGKAQPLEYKTLDANIYLIKTPMVDIPSVIQFKNAYDAGWRLIKVSDNLWETLNSTRFKDIFELKLTVLYRLLHASAGQNIEYYSNGWDINDKSGTYVVFYAYEILTDVSIAISMFSIFISGILILKRKS